jgi:hypothetical protein
MSEPQQLEPLDWLAASRAQSPGEDLEGVEDGIVCCVGHPVPPGASSEPLSKPVLLLCRVVRSTLSLPARESFLCPFLPSG